MNHKTSYRILKLVNGDDIIGEITESSSKKLALYRPFQMKVITIADADQSSLFQTEVLMMRNWLSLTNEINSIIARNHVISISIPKESIIKCYEEEKKKEDDPDYLENKHKEILDELENAKENEEYEFTIDPEFIEKILNDIMKSKESTLPFMEEDYIDNNNEDSNVKEYDDQDTDKDMFGF